jgi:hypothetical protein
MTQAERRSCGASTPSILALKAILIKKYDAALLVLRGEMVLIESRGTFARSHLCRQIFERRVCQSWQARATQKPSPAPYEFRDRDWRGRTS